MKTDFSNISVVCARCNGYWPLKNFSFSTKKKILKETKSCGWNLCLGTVRKHGINRLTNWELRLPDMEFFCPTCSGEEELTWTSKSGQK